MSKKGLSYVDWVISLGTFLIAILFIIILVRPKIEPESEKPALLALIEENFYQDTEWTVHEIPVFIHKLQKVYTDTSGTTKNSRITLSYSSGFAHAMTPSLDLYTFGTLNAVIECTAPVCNDVTTSILLAPQNPLNSKIPGISLACTPSDTAICDAALGATLSTQGISNDQLTFLSHLGYDDLKANWHIPSTKEFAIFIDNNNILASPKPPLNADVYSKERTYWKLTKDNIRTPITIHFQVW